MLPNNLVSCVKDKAAILLLFLVLILSTSAGNNSKIVILYKKGSQKEVALAARELQRYLYLRTGSLPTLKAINKNTPLTEDCIVVGTLNSMKSLKWKINLPDTLSNQEYVLKSLGNGHLFIVGGSGIAALYGAYKFLESTGIGFSIDRDIIPDKQISHIRLSGFNKIYKPSFNLRGILPFHDFPEGPDWWNENDYKAVITQLPKMGMNFIGFHTYPVTVPFRGGQRAEPLVWIGLKSQFNQDGTVKNAYPVLHANTHDSSWGYSPRKTSAYCCGASQIFETDYYGADYMKNLSAWSHTVQENIGIFNKVGILLKGAFTMAKDLGVKTCVGTEVPLTIPGPVKKVLHSKGIDLASEGARQEVYEGIFSRIKVTYPIDYYWLWTPESWTWQGESDQEIKSTETDILDAIAAAKKVNAPFALATCGWVLGPTRNRAEFDALFPKAMPFSCINRDVGNTPVDKGFEKIKGRPKWAISWLEDDPGLTAPQFWAGRVLKDGVDAYKYGCTGFMGIHWRTQILSPAFMALSYAGWNAGQLNMPEPDTMRDYPPDALYLHWAGIQFGQNAAQKMAGIFVKLDGKNNFPRPADWVKGPGSIRVNETPWEKVEKRFSFIKDLENCKSLIIGKGDEQRYQYWLNTFYYTRAMAKTGCLLGQMQLIAGKIKREKDETIRRQQALQLLSLRNSAASEWERMETYLLETVNTTGAMGTIANLEDHNLGDLHLLTNEDSLITVVTGDTVPPLELPQTYTGESRLIITTRRTLLQRGESLDMKVRVLTNDSIRLVKIYWKPLGAKDFKNNIPLPRIARHVYQVHLSSHKFDNHSFEYYIKVELSSGQLIYPVNAPEINQTVVLW